VDSSVGEAVVSDVADLATVATGAEVVDNSTDATVPKATIDLPASAAPPMESTPVTPRGAITSSRGGEQTLETVKSSRTTADVAPDIAAFKHELQQAASSQSAKPFDPVSLVQADLHPLVKTGITRITRKRPAAAVAEDAEDDLARHGVESGETSPIPHSDKDSAESSANGDVGDAASGSSGSNHPTPTKRRMRRKCKDVNASHVSTSVAAVPSQNADNIGLDRANEVDTVGSISADTGDSVEGANGGNAGAALKPRKLQKEKKEQKLGPEHRQYLALNKRERSRYITGLTLAQQVKLAKALSLAELGG
jgi:hypothetical protein